MPINKKIDKYTVVYFKMEYYTAVRRTNYSYMTSRKTLDNAEYRIS